jgi:multidrug efflux system outer membrane protein
MKKHLPMRTLSACVLFASLAACSLAPDYQRPEAPIPVQWPQAVKAEGRDAFATAWRSYFTDPRLQSLIAAALDHNRDLRVAIARVEEARGLAGMVGADRWPNLSIGGGRTASLTPAGVSQSGKELEISYYSGGINLLSFELDFWGRTKNLSAAALATYLASDAARRAFRLSLIGDVAAAYFSERELEERLALARETMRSRLETRKFINLRRQVGLAGDLDYLQADGAYETARADAASLERQVAAAKTALQLLVGTEIRDLPATRPLVEAGVIADLNPGLPSDVLLRRPDVLAAEQSLIAANANIGAVRAAFFPRLSLIGMLGSASPALSGLFKAGTGAWSFAPSLSMPLFDGGRNSANLDIAEARKVIAVAQYEKTIQTAFKEVADLLNARATLAEQLQAQERLQVSQEQRLQLTEARYKAGIANHLELLEAQRDAFSAQQATLQVRRLQLATAALLYKALGGGDE